jgi:hypothetical protein
MFYLNPKSMAATVAALVLLFQTELVANNVAVAAAVVVFVFERPFFNPPTALHGTGNGAA